MFISYPSGVGVAVLVLRVSSGSGSTSIVPGSRGGVWLPVFDGVLTPELSGVQMIVTGVFFLSG